MARPSKLTYDRGTLILHPPPRGKAWIDLATWDDRIEKFRIPAIYYRRLIETHIPHICCPIKNYGLEPR